MQNNENRIDRNNVEDILALSPLQMGILFHYLSHPHSYFEQLSFRLTGFDRTDLIVRAWHNVMQANQMLRVIFRWEKLDEPVQLILKSQLIPVAEHDLSHVPASEHEARLAQLKAEDKEKGIDLRSSAFRLLLCKLSDTEQEMVLSYHHILFDGWSTSLLLKEFVQAYRDLLADGQTSLPVKPSYKGYIVWHKKQDYSQHALFWVNYLEGFGHKTQLPAKRKSMQAESFVSADHQVITRRIPAERQQQLQQFAKQQEVTLAAVIYTAWGLVLQRYNNTDDVVFGSTVSGRKAPVPGIEQMAGLFTNTLPLRIRTEDGDTVSRLVKRVNRQLLEREEFEATPLVTINALHEIGKNEQLFDSIAVIENYPVDQMFAQKDAGFSLALSSMSKMINYPLALGVYPFDELDIEISYNEALFEPAMMEGLAEHFVRLLLHLAADGDADAARLDMLTAQERQQLLVEWSSAEAPSLMNSTVPELFEQIAAKWPDHPAVVMREQSYTFRELNEKANRLARTLRANGVQPGRVVALLLEKSLDMILGITAVLKAGGAYLPIDPGNPQERIRFMLEDSQASIVLSTSRWTEELAFSGIVLDLEQPGAYAEDAGNLPQAAGPNDLAVIYYTSGSTGQPKGVMLEQHGITNFPTFFRSGLAIDETDRIAQFASFTFNATIWEVFMGLLTGATLYLLPPELIADKTKFTRYMNEQRITTVTMAPTYLSELDPAQFPLLKRLITAGSETTRELAELWGKDRTYINAYGLTEVTTAAFLWTHEPDQAAPERIPIGRVFQNKRAYILDRHLQPLPVGVIGELCLAGAGVARGYFNQPQLNADKFVPDPFVPGAMMFRTGDLAFRLPDGQVQLTGRADRQVKVRGFRIELGEIEAVLHKHPAVRQAVVIARDDAVVERYLCAYVVMEDGRSDPAAELKSFCSQFLPAYMIPVAFVPIEAMPLNATRKIDYKQLPDPKPYMHKQADLDLPENDIQLQVAEIWRAILGVQLVGIRDNFFDLGGNSILLMRLHARLDKQFPGVFDITDLFAQTCVLEQAEFIDRKLRQAEETVLTELIFPADALIEGETGLRTGGYEWALPGSLYRSLQDIAASEHTEVDVILVAMLMYHLSEWTGQSSVALETMLRTVNASVQARIDVEALDDLAALFRETARQTVNPEASRPLEELGRSARTLGGQGVLVFFYKGNCLTQATNVLNVFDLALGCYEDNGEASLTIEYRTNRLREDKVEQLIQQYANVLQSLVQQYAAEAR